MNANSAFIIGATHAICQDYAVAGGCVSPQLQTDIQAQPYAILADGCSASPDTDVGARLLVKAAQLLLHSSAGSSPEDLPDFHREAARRALVHAELIGLPPQAVDATLLTAHLRGESLVVGCSGDGVILLQSWTGVTNVYSISYASGYPLYPAYAHQPARLLALERAGRAIKEISHYRRLSDGEPFHLQESLTSDSLTEVFTAEIGDCKLAALLSDGVHSFSFVEHTETIKRVKPLPLEETLAELIAFKNTHGAFVARRMKRFKRDCGIKGWQHADDLAMGAVYLGD